MRNWAGHPLANVRIIIIPTWKFPHRLPPKQKQTGHMCTLHGRIALMVAHGTEVMVSAVHTWLLLQLCGVLQSVKCVIKDSEQLKLYVIIRKDSQMIELCFNYVSYTIYY